MDGLILTFNCEINKPIILFQFSVKLNKLYCHPNVACPIDISVSSLPPSGSVVRATPVFSKYEHIEQVVTRCENHKKSKEFDSDGI